ncbi:glycosyltransferase [Priestia megaterium]|uniref:glycosyltransferase n=1 Tax=Priestia megaterium TaxID=1404 RepID=UPI0020D28A51|nr:glycosyltransferase [Priestia megaterium]
MLLVHNYYQESGGEDQVLKQEIDLLKENGHEVITYTKHNNEIQTYNVFQKISLFFKTTFSLKEYFVFKRVLKKISPDIVHFHNFFPLFSPSVYYACQDLKIPVIQTLHNYRLICPAATFMRDNEVCEKCLSGSLINSIKYGCYRGSKVQTIPVANMIYINNMLKTWHSKVNYYITLTEFAQKKFIDYGLPKEKVVVKPNFLDKSSNVSCSKENTILFVGRLSKEKGVDILIKAWKSLHDKQDYKLLIAGDGEERVKLQKLAENQNDVKFLGKIPSDSVKELMGKSKYLVVPSRWYEGLPMTIVESYSAATPVICSKLGSLEEIVEDNVTGFHFKVSNHKDLALILEKAINISSSDYQHLSRKSLEAFKNKYDKHINYKILFNIYKKAVGEQSK